MKFSLSEPGIILSGAVHATALVLLLVAFSEAPPLPEQHEAVPIETISNADFEAMQGQKDVTDIKADAPPPADKIAETTNSAPPSPKPVTVKDNAAPPPPAPPEPVKDDTPPPEPAPPPPPPEPVAQEPPPPPVPEPPVRPLQAEAPPPPPDIPLPPVQPAPPPPPVPMPPTRAVADAETIAPTPPPKPQPPKPVKVAEPKPMPPKPVPPPPPPKPVEAKAPPKPHPDKPKQDLLAKLLDQPIPDRPIHKAIAHPKPAEPQPEQHQFDLNDISKLLSSAEPPSQKASTGRQISRTRVAGSETGVSQKMAASLWDQLDGLLEDQYKQCWNYLGLDGPSKYVPQIKVVYSEDGGLMTDPVLINPPSDPAMRSLAESAVRAVRRCNPLKIPAQYAPYYDQWKGRVLRFDPVDMAG